MGEEKKSGVSAFGRYPVGFIRENYSAWSTAYMTLMSSRTLLE